MFYLGGREMSIEYVRSPNFWPVCRPGLPQKKRPQRGGAAGTVPRFRCARAAGRTHILRISAPPMVPIGWPQFARTERQKKRPQLGVASWDRSQIGHLCRGPAPLQNAPLRLPFQRNGPSPGGGLRPLSSVSARSASAPDYSN